MDLTFFRPYVAKGNGNCLCPALPKALRRCRMNGTCTLAAGTECETAAGIFDRSRMPIRFPGTSGSEELSGYTHDPSAYKWLDLPLGLRRQQQRMAATTIATVQTGRAAAFDAVTAKIMAGYNAAKAIAELPAEPLPEQMPRMKFIGWAHPKAGKKKAGFTSRRLWLKSQRRRKAGTQEF